MKHMKKIISIMLAMVMVLGMGVTAFAEENNNKQITIKSSPTVDVADGREFTAYKILDAQAVTEDSVVYTVPESMEAFYNERYNLTGNEPDYARQVAENIEKEDDLYKFANAALAYAKDHVDGKSGAVENGNYVISELGVGYYVIEDSTTGEAASQVMLDTTITNLEITVKADVPTIDKKIDGAEDTDGDTNSPSEFNNAAVGDKVPYVVTTKVPAMAGYNFYRFVIKDTLSEGLTFDEGDDLSGSVTIRIGTLKTNDDGKYFVNSDGKYEFVSEPTTLTSVADAAAAVNREEDAESAYYVKKTDNEDGTITIEIVFVDFIKLAPDHVGEDIVVEYSATLNEAAVIGAAGNPNTVSLKYSNNPSEEGDGSPEENNPYEFEVDGPFGETEEVVVKTFVTALELVKLNDAGQTLAGAAFTIEGERLNKVFVNGMHFMENENGNYWGYNGTYTTQDPAEYERQLKELEDMPEEERPTNYAESVEKLNDVLGRYEKKEGEYVKYAKEIVAPGEGDEWQTVDSATHVTETLTVDKNGEIVFRGLGAGTYTITEVKAPDGYNMLAAPIGVVIQVTYKEGADGTGSAEWSGEYAELVKDEEGVYKLPDREQNAAAYHEITFDGTQGVFVEFQVVNSTGTLLPSTGGIGTTIFYVTGSILVLAAVVLLVTKKRMAKEK